MSKITAVILAAGMGVRMGPRGKLMPKGFLQVGGATLIEQSVAALRTHGVGRIIIVTGHLSRQYEALYGGTDIELIYNPHYANTGSLQSLFTALPVVETACLIAESDLVYAPQALAPLDGRVNRFLVSGLTGAGDEQYVWTQKDQSGRDLMQDVSKDRNFRAETPLGEMIGLSVLTADTVKRMCNLAQRELARTPEEHYEPGFVALAREVEIECPLLLDLPWAEVDDEDMLDRAERLVFPRVAAARAALV